MTTDEKENPKHLRALAEGKAPLEYLVWSVLEGEAHVLRGGAEKYGIRNWLKKRIKASTYEGAMLRHLKAWAEGEDNDPDSGKPHLQHLRACVAVVLDADAHDMLIDDRDRCTSINDEQQDAQSASAQALRDYLSDRPDYRLSFDAGLKCKEPEQRAAYAVRFDHMRMSAGSPLRCIIYEGMFTTFGSAETHAHTNPNNTPGLKSIQFIHKP